MKNKMEQVAKMLGVELGEKFVLDHGPNLYSFYKFENDLLRLNLFGEWVADSCELLHDLIAGKETIKKIPNNPKPTYEERAILENIDYNYRWIARCEDGDLVICIEKPIKGMRCWKTDSVLANFATFNHLFKFIKWEDEKPHNIENLLKGEFNG